MHVQEFPSNVSVNMDLNRDTFLLNSGEGGGGGGGGLLAIFWGLVGILPSTYQKSFRL